MSTPAPAPSANPIEDGLNHIATLQQSGDYAAAAEYAVGTKNELRRDFTVAAFHAWGRAQPEQALAAAARIQDYATRQYAFQSALSGWARAEPEEMAETALAFPEGEEQKAALTKALRAWMVKDPATAGDWIISHGPAVAVADEMFTKDRR